MFTSLHPQLFVQGPKVGYPVHQHLLAAMQPVRPARWKAGGKRRPSRRRWHFAQSLFGGVSYFTEYAHELETQRAEAPDVQYVPERLAPAPDVVPPTALAVEVSLTLLPLEEVAAQIGGTVERPTRVPRLDESAASSSTAAPRRVAIPQDAL